MKGMRLMSRRDNPNLKGFSTALRKNQTKEEKHLWYDFLRQYPVRFNRQKVLGPYIVDFYCASAKLVIELDGSQHYSEEGSDDDKIRDRYLARLGIKVVRYSNLEITREFDAVCVDISEHVKERMQ